MRFLSAWVKICQILHVNFEMTQVSFSSNIASFFSVMTHNSPVNFKLIHFLLWTKGSHESTNFYTFKCSDENLPNSSCHFPNHKSVFSQILHDCSVSWKITPLWFFRSGIIYFFKGTNQSSNFLKGPIKVQILETFENSYQNLPSSCHFWNSKSVFLQILHHFSVSWDVTPLYFFSWNFMYFQWKEPLKVKIWWNFTWPAGSLKFCTLMGSFRKNHITFQLKKYRRVILHDMEEWC